MIEKDITIVTTKGVTKSFRLKDIESIYLNVVTLKFRYKKWLKDGVFEIEEFEVSPEDLKGLIELIKSEHKNLGLSIDSSNEFLKVFPTSDKLNEAIELANESLLKKWIKFFNYQFPNHYIFYIRVKVFFDYVVHT